MEVISMNITKDYFEKQLKKHDKVTVYAQDNIPLTISKGTLQSAVTVRVLSSTWTVPILADYCNSGRSVHQA